MSATVSDFIIERLKAWGITRIYGYPGDGINGLTAAMRKAEDNPRFIQVRHEEMAAFISATYALSNSAPTSFSRRSRTS
jgi:pyruvate dehydrogenase (quinone)